MLKVSIVSESANLELREELGCTATSSYCSHYSLNNVLRCFKRKLIQFRGVIYGLINTIDRNLTISILFHSKDMVLHRYYLPIFGSWREM